MINRIYKYINRKTRPVKAFYLKIWSFLNGAKNYEDLPYLDYIDESNNSKVLKEKGSYSKHLYAVVRHLKPNITVELGVKAGITMKHILEAVKKNEKKTRVIGIDLPFDNPNVGDPYKSTLDDDFYKKNSEIWRMNTQSSITVNHFLNETNNKEIDILFIDADHSYKGAQIDYNLWSKYVRDGGFIFFDDVQQYSPRKVWKKAKGREKFLIKCNRSKDIQLLGVIIK
jgi:predicted O-methyltransferase YrrM